MRHANYLLAPLIVANKEQPRVHAVWVIKLFSVYFLRAAEDVQKRNHLIKLKTHNADSGEVKNSFGKNSAQLTDRMFVETMNPWLERTLLLIS